METKTLPVPNPDWKRVRPEGRPEGMAPGENRYYMAVDYVRFGTLGDILDKPPPDEVLAHVGRTRVMVGRYDDIMAILAEAATLRDDAVGRFARNLRAAIETAPPAASTFGNRTSPFGPLAGASGQETPAYPLKRLSTGRNKLSADDIELLRHDIASASTRFVWRETDGKFQVICHRTGQVASTRKFPNAREAAREARRRNGW